MQSTILSDMPLSKMPTPFITAITPGTYPKITFNAKGQVTGGSQLQITNYGTGFSSGTYSVQATDDVILVNSAAALYGGLGVNLPIASVAGKVYIIKKIDFTNNTVAVTATSSQIDGSSSSQILSYHGQEMTVVADGFNWYVVSQVNVTPPGALMMWITTTAPNGWLVCDGSAVSRTTYQILFQVIGTTYGAGDGSTTFNLPDLRSRTPIGYAASSPGTGRSARALSNFGGQETTTLAIANMPSHTHTVSTCITAPGGSGAPTGTGWTLGTVTSGSAGSGTAYNNMSPFLVVNYIIKT